MLVVHEESTQHFLDVMKFALTVNLHNQFLEQLTYLCGYGNGPDSMNDRNKGGNTKCVLYRDFAPHSFEFVMYRLRKPTSLDGKETGIRTHLMMTPEQMAAYYDDVNNWERWFNGGLIYQGPGLPADGSAPSFTVSLAKGNGWFVHT